MTSNHRRKRSAHKSVSNQLYNQVESPILCLSEEIFAYPVQFHELVSSQPTENQQEEITQQVFSTSENVESVKQVNEFSCLSSQKTSSRLDIKQTKKKKKRNYVHMIRSKISFFVVVLNLHVQH